MAGVRDEETFVLKQNKPQVNIRILSAILRILQMKMPAKQTAHDDVDNYNFSSIESLLGPMCHWPFAIDNKRESVQCSQFY